VRSEKRMLIGGVPYGYDNVGDEAILACIVDACREVCPHGEITVLTGKPQETAQRLGVNAVKLKLGAKKGKFVWDRDLLSAFLHSDIFIWGGANGLSDYPQMSLKMVLLSKLLGKKVMIYAVGLEPIRHTSHPNQSWRRWICRVADTLLKKEGRFQELYEGVRTAVLRLCIRLVCNRVDLITVRDAESVALLQEYGVRKPLLVTTADPALLLQDGASALPKMEFAKANGVIGVCVSSQQPPPSEGKKAIAQVLDSLVQKYGVWILFIPMNPQTDSLLMHQIRAVQVEKGKTLVLEGEHTPQDVLAIVRQTDLILSSRLHLLILAVLANTPCIGLSRGSKIDRFLTRARLPKGGDVRTINPFHLQEVCERTWRNRQQIREQMRRVLGDMQQAARKNQDLLAVLVNGGF